MSFVDRCIFLPTTGGTGTWTVSSAVLGYLTPAQAGAANATLYRYTAELRDGSNAVTAWEVGSGTYTAAGTTLTRTPIFSSNANAAVNFATPPQVMLCILAEDLFAPAVSDGAALGSLTLPFSDLFLATGGVINFANDCTITHGSDSVNFEGATTGWFFANPFYVFNAPASVLNTGAGNSQLSLYDTTDGGWTFYSQDGSLNIATVNTSGVFTALWIGIANTGIAQFYNSIAPGTNDSSALGFGTVAWSDLFLASGGVINWNNGNVTLTHAAGALTLAGCTLTTNSASAILKSGTTITGGATGNVPTLTAGPVTGNPTKWLPYDDNGVTRYIPSW